MPGKVVRVLCAVGEEVSEGQGLLVVEAMKMQNEVQAPKSGRVTEIRVTDGQTVNAGEPLAIVE
jgi:biotin carboxyl carrier protein